MSPVRAISISTDFSLSACAEVFRIEYELGNLTVYLRTLDSSITLIVTFDDVLGFRVHDEGRLLEYWPECSSPNGWLFEIVSGGWQTQEIERIGPLMPERPNVREYLVAGEDDCVSVLCATPPQVRQHVL